MSAVVAYNVPPGLTDKWLIKAQLFRCTPADVENKSSKKKMESGHGISLQDIDTRSKYRAGWPQLCSAPPYTDLITQHDYGKRAPEADREKLRSRINEILNKHDISQRLSHSIAYRSSFLSGESLSFNHLRVLVDCVYDPEQQEKHPDSWALAVIDIHKAIHETIDDPRNIGIELYDSEYERSIHLSDLPADCQDIVANWNKGNKYRQQVLDVFKDRPNLWQAMLLTGIEASNERTKDHRCVLWFDALDANNVLWSQVEAEIAFILPGKVSLEIWQASHSVLCTGGIPESTPVRPSTTPIDKRLMQWDFERPPKPGSSLGAMGDASGGGTLGGYISVLEPTNDAQGNTTTSERRYALTNAHVVLRHDETTSRKLWSKQKLQLTGPMAVPVQCPSMKDCNAYLNWCTDIIESAQKTIDKNEEKLAQLQEYNVEDKIESVRQVISRASHRHNQFTQNAQVARGSRHIGDVRAVSLGTCIHKNADFLNRLAMDLALVDVTPLIPDPSLIYLNEMYGQILPQSILGTWEADNLSSEARDDDDDYTNLVAMFGRASGFKQGRIHPIAVDIKIKDEDGKEHTFSAWAIRSIVDQEPFAELGDSGSFVFTGRGWKLAGLDDDKEIRYTDEETTLSVVGMVFASSPRGHVGYFIPFDAIIDEVEALTGGKVTWPVKRQ